MAKTGSFEDVIALSDGAAAKFGKAVVTSEKKILSEVITMLKDLELTKSGNIASTTGNLKKMMIIRTKLYKLANNKEYLAAVKDLIASFDEIYKKQIGVLALKDKIGRGEEKYKLSKEIAVENTVAALSGDGLAANVTNKISEMLLTAVTSGAKFSDLQGQLYEYLADTEKSQGALTRYATTWSVTALSQYTGQINKLATDDLDYEWFEYVGSNIETTREFCQHVTKKRYVHVSELPDLLKGHVEYDGEVHQCAIYPKTDLPYGMIEGTTVDNLQINCGGWNCRHQFFPVASEAVPKALRDAIEAKNGPSEKEKALIQKAKDLLALQPKYPCMYQEDFDDLLAALNADPMDYQELDYNCQFVEGAMETHREDYAKAEVKAKDAIAYNENIKNQYGVGADTSSVEAEMNNGVYDWKALEKKAAELMKAANALMLDYTGKVSDAEKLIDKYGATKMAGGVKKEDIKGASLQELDALIKKLEGVAAKLKSYKNIPDLDDAAKELDEQELDSLNKEIADAEAEYNAKTSLADKKHLLDITKNSVDVMDPNDPLAKVYKEWLNNKYTELMNEQIVEDINKQLKDVGDYVDAHPKSSKVKNLLDEATSAFLSGDYDEANKKIQDALKVIDINEGSKKSKAAKAAAKKAAKATGTAQTAGASAQSSASDNIPGLKNISVTDADLSLHTMEELAAVDAAVQAKIDSWSSLPLSVQKKKLEFEITWVESNKKYSTWKIAQNAYAKKLNEVVNKINNELIGDKLDNLKYYVSGSVLSISSVQSKIQKIKNGIVNNDSNISLQQEYAQLEKLINNEMAKGKAAAKKKEAEEQKHLRENRTNLTESDLNVDQTDDIYWQAVQKTINRGKAASKITKKQKDDLFGKLSVAMANKNRTEADKILLQLGYDPHDVYGEWRKDMAVYFLTAKEANEHFYYSAEEYYAIATEAGKKAFAGYTAGSAYITEPLRAILGHYYYYTDKMQKTETDILNMTSELNKCSFREDMWIKRDSASWQVEYIFNIPSLSAFRSNPSALVGKTGIDKSFMSCGSCKKTRFDVTENKDVIYNLYVPAGAKAVYAHPFSSCGAYGINWDGKKKCVVDDGKENEIILQRGTQLRITKAEYDATKNMWYLDLDVIGQNSEDFDMAIGAGGYYCKFK